jgi:hypothetical protein
MGTFQNRAGQTGQATESEPPKEKGKVPDLVVRAKAVGEADVAFRTCGVGWTSDGGSKTLATFKVANLPVNWDGVLKVFNKEDKKEGE